jgi:hypothetical protein
LLSLHVRQLKAERIVENFDILLKPDREVVGFMLPDVAQ